jgi:hypothetical protein
MPGTPPHLLRRSGIHIPFYAEAPSFRHQACGCSLDANNLLNHEASGRAELQRLRHNGFLVVAEAATKCDGGGHDRGDDDNALQTLHGLLSFG